MEFHSTVTFTSNPVSFAIFTDPNLFGCFALEFLATLYFACRTAPGPSQHKKLLRLFSCHDPSSCKADDMKEPLNVDVAIRFICISLRRPKNIYTMEAAKLF